MEDRGGVYYLSWFCRTSAEMKLRVALALFACVAGIAVRANDEDVAIGEDASDEIVSSAVIESCAG